MEQVELNVKRVKDIQEKEFCCGYYLCLLGFSSHHHSYSRLTWGDLQLTQ